MTTQQTDVNISNEFLFEDAPSTETPVEQTTTPESEDLTEEVNVEDVFNQFQDPESYVKNIIDNFGEAEKENLDISVRKYIEFTEEYEARVNEFFLSNPNPKEENDFDSLQLDTSDERYTTMWQQVLPILDILIQAGKVDSEVLLTVTETNQRLGKASLILNSFVLFNEQQTEMANHQLDGGVTQATFRMAEYQFTNILRTLNIARAENRLRNEDIDDLTNIAKKILDNTTTYLSFLEIDNTIIHEVYNVTLDIIEQYKPFAIE